MLRLGDPGLNKKQRVCYKNWEEIIIQKEESSVKARVVWPHFGEEGPERWMELAEQCG